MGEIMRDMGEEGALGLQPVNDLKRVGDSGMRRGRLVTQSIKKQNGGIVQPLKRGLGDLAEVREIGGRTETKTKDLGISMQDLYRQETGAPQLHGSLNRVK